MHFIGELKKYREKMPVIKLLIKFKLKQFFFLSDVYTGKWKKKHGNLLTNYSKTFFFYVLMDRNNRVT